MNFLSNFFQGDNDEILFFILVFLFLFNGNLFGKCNEGDGIFDNNTILFFIILFLLLFFNQENEYDPK